MNNRNQLIIQIVGMFAFIVAIAFFPGYQIPLYLILIGVMSFTRVYFSIPPRHRRAVLKMEVFHRQVAINFAQYFLFGLLFFALMYLLGGI